MKTNSINIILSLLAGIIVLIYSLIFNYSIQKTAITLIGTVLIFLILGTIIRSILNRIIASKSIEEASEDVVDTEIDEDDSEK